MSLFENDCQWSCHIIPRTHRLQNEKRREGGKKEGLKNESDKTLGSFSVEKLLTSKHDIMGFYSKTVQIGLGSIHL